MTARDVLTIGVAVLFAPLLATAAEEEDSSAERLFARRVFPLLQSRCFVCHGDDPDDVRGRFDMRSRDGMLRGGESGEPSLVPGQAEQSPLYLAATRQTDLWSPMPPKENDQLTADETVALREWIDGGSPWPDAERRAELARWTETDEPADGVTVRTSGGLSAEWTSRRYDPENLWAYQPLAADPAERAARAARSPIDLLIEARLAELTLEPAPAADRRTLIRRATFDLIGLPPTPEEVEAFVRDPRMDAVVFAELIDRLLASPHYGEQWGRHWLDVVRYADSSGYANDYERGNAWRYRDYVVRAFNHDKPYDRFIREQIAGDEIDADNPEMLIATGFLRMGPWELTGMEVPAVARQRFLDDVTDIVGQVFLGHMLQCARCHDHKFDPVPTRDYYSLQAVFATTQMAERPAGFLAEENTSGFEEKKYLLQRRDGYQRQLDELAKQQSLAAARRWYREQHIDPAPFDETVAILSAEHPGRAVRLQQVRQRMAERDVHPDRIPPRHVGFSPRDFGLERIARKGIERLKWRMDRYEPLALSVYSGRTPQLRAVLSPPSMPDRPWEEGELEQTHILAGGDPFSPIQPVEPGVLSAVALMATQAGTSHRTSSPEIRSNAGRAPGSERRTALAEWITSPANPLTARVMVNRIWQWHFGKPLAGNPNNFGATGRKPTHPELLDWLAAEFMARGWSVKAMHRLIMESDAYQRSSRHPDPDLLDLRDPRRESYAAFLPRRLDAEELRDAILAVTGELSRVTGGIPVRPEINLEVALQPRQVMGTFAEAWQPSARPAARHRRSIYALRIRGQRDPFLEVFNTPSPDISCEARESSTGTPQVFTLLNSPHTYDRALAMARRLLEETPTDAAAIDRAIQLVYGRFASQQERALCLAHWEVMIARHESLAFEAPAYPREVEREAVEENTGVRFSFTEPLEVYADFVPDLKPADAGPRLRALAEVCLVLLNSNEFVFVY